MRQEDTHDEALKKVDWLEVSDPIPEKLGSKSAWNFLEEKSQRRNADTLHLRYLALPPQL